jgi:hypothetical protein
MTSTNSGSRTAWSDIGATPIKARRPYHDSIAAATPQPKA